MTDKDRTGRIVDTPETDGGPEALKSRTLREMTFSTHIISLNAMALMHLGEMDGVPDDERDLDAARHTIDTLVVLKEKTAGNLTLEEEQLLGSVLYDLRMKFLRHAGGR